MTALFRICSKAWLAQPGFSLCLLGALVFGAPPLAAQDLRFLPEPEKQPAAPPALQPAVEEPIAKPKPEPVETPKPGPAPLIRAAEPTINPGTARSTPTAAEPAPLVAGPSAAKIQPEKEPLSEEPIPIKRKPIDVDSIMPASFNGIIPGQSSESHVTEELGEPIEQMKRGRAVVYVYKVEPFRRVEVSLVDQVAASVAIYLPQPEPADDLAKRLKVEDFASVNVPDETGRPLGRVYPERAVLFAFTASSSEKNPMVAQVLLEPIGPEPFVLRAWHGPGSRLSDRLADLEYALSLEPNDAKAHWLRAVLNSAVGNDAEAMAAAAQAAHLDSSEPRYQLTMAELQARIGAWESAQKTARKLADDTRTPPEIAARATLLLGDIAARGGQADYETALRLHQEAIRQARPLVDDTRVGIRRLARQTLLDAHLAITRDIAFGRFQKKLEAIDRWAAQANELVEQMIEQDGGPRLLRLKLHRDVLTAYAEARTEADPAAAADDAIEEARRAIRANEDPLLRRHVEWLLGEVLTAAVQIEQQRGNKEAALRFAGNAVALMEASIANRESSPLENYTLAKLKFRIGSIYAVLEEDHLEAAKWYQQAVPVFEQPLPAALLGEMADQGERFVSMGVSYWKAGLRPRGLELTVKGVEDLEIAVSDKLLDSRSLAIPYGNLASMYKQLGQTEKARRYAELAARYEPVAAKPVPVKPQGGAATSTARATPHTPASTPTRTPAPQTQHNHNHSHQHSTAPNSARGDKEPLFGSRQSPSPAANRSTQDNDKKDTGSSGPNTRFQRR